MNAWINKHANLRINEWLNIKMIKWSLRIKICDSSIKTESFSKASAQMASFFPVQSKAMPNDPESFLEMEGWLCPCGLNIQLKTDQCRLFSRLSVPNKCSQCFPTNERVSRATLFKACPSLGNSHSPFWWEQSWLTTVLMQLLLSYSRHPSLKI